MTAEQLTDAAKHAELKKYDKDLRKKYFDLSSRLIIDNTTERW